MKRILSLTLIVSLALTLAACGNKAPASSSTPIASSTPPVSSTSDSSDALVSGDDMSLTDLMASLLQVKAEMPVVSDVPLTAENFKSFTFIDPVEGAEALASEAMIGSMAHSVVLVRVAEGTDVAAVAKEMETNLNPRKWICTEAEKTVVTTHGNTILLVMSFEDLATEIVANFDTLWA